MEFSRREMVVGSLALTLAPPSGRHSSSSASAPRIEFISSPLGDFLHLLFFRQEKARFAAFDAPGFAAAPQLDYLLAVPELVAAAGLNDYAQVEPFVSETFAALPASRVSTPRPRILSYGAPSAEIGKVLDVIRAGEPFYKPFLAYWRREVQPQVETQIAVWRQQDQTHQPLRRLTALHRLLLRSDRFLLAAMPFHPAGSANYSPASVFTTLFRTPDLGRVLGHEASHLLWSAAVGTDWKAHALGGRVGAMGEAKGVDVEETMCLLMQTKLSQICGVQPAEYRVSADLPDGPQLALMVALEQEWEAYLAGGRRWPSLIDYVLETSVAALG